MQYSYDFIYTLLIPEVDEEKSKVYSNYKIPLLIYVFISGVYRVDKRIIHWSLTECGLPRTVNLISRTINPVLNIMLLITLPI